MGSYDRSVTAILSCMTKLETSQVQRDLQGRGEWSEERGER